MSIGSSEYALLAQDSYIDRPHDKDKTVVIGGVDYKILDTKTNSITGYQGTVYRRIDTGEVIIAHRGTEFGREPIKDGVIVDGGMVSSGLNVQAPEAEAFTQHAIELAKQAGARDGKPLHITITGHSLGGTLAELTAYKFHLQGETFNAYGAAGLLHGVPEGGNQVINHVRATDVVSAASKHFGEVRIYATSQDIDRLSHAHYRDDGAGLRNVIGAIDPSAHGIANFIPDAQGHSAFDPENTARYRAHHATVDRFRHDVLTTRTIVSARWEVQKEVQQFAYEAGEMMAMESAARLLQTYDAARDAALNAGHFVGKTYDQAHDAIARSTQAMNESVDHLVQSFSALSERHDSKLSAAKASIAPVLLDDPSHPGHTLFQQGMAAVQQLNAKQDVNPSYERDACLAGALAAAAVQAGVVHIDRVSLSKDAATAYALDDRAMHDLWGHTPWSAQVDVATALNTPLTQSSESLAQATQHRLAEERQREQQQLQPLQSTPLRSAPAM
ncbi:XVIPCD domain-containing protein [Dyella sp.]|uniref:XVIPCD domain-containing protein n=1 Tax=Dyella sp. TaxID=1869338 RepID=UPI002B465E6A|nr:XVIPCD domain-containing protein [Dyella sp.]HKT29206.1 XVIPCD domain-containing protein [Dyella sp.]